MRYLISSVILGGTAVGEEAKAFSFIKTIKDWNSLSDLSFGVRTSHTLWNTLVHLLTPMSRESNEVVLSESLSNSKLYSSFSGRWQGSHFSDVF